jgi:membrane protein implicated in regulation of membrane protease activity
VVFALLIGLFLGRVATENVAPGALGLLDLIMYAALAACVAIAFRRWARRNVEERRRQQLRRRQSREHEGPEEE